MKSRQGRLESAKKVELSADDAPARRYASFVVRGWRPGATGMLEIAHDQSGERVRAASLSEAIGWIQSHAVPAASAGDARGGDYREKLGTRTGECRDAVAA